MTNSPSRRRGDLANVWGRHQKATSSPATSLTGLGACRRTIVACFVFRREISRKAVWDFFDSIEPFETSSAQWPPMRFVARDRLSDELTLGKMAGLTEISAMGSFEALAIVVVFVLAAVVVITLVQTRRR